MSLVSVSRDGPVRTVTLTRAEKRNALNMAMLDALEAAFAEPPEPIDRVVVLRAEGPAFCAGMDLSVFTGGSALDNDASEEVGRQRANLRTNAMHLQRTFSALEEARMPVLAAMHGGVVGGAVDMVTAADCRYATEDAWFCIQEINIGMTADVGTLQRLPKLIPDGIVRELAYTGDRMSAARAKDVGLVNEVYPDQAAMLEDVFAIAGRIASKSPLAVYGSKQSIVYARDHSVADSLNQIATWQTGMFQPRDMMESFQAQMEKRDPEFDDLNPVRRGL